MRKKHLLNNDLIALLRTLTKDEFKKLGLYLRSKYFGYRNSLSILLIELKRFHPLYTHIHCTKELLYARVYPGKTFNEDSMRDLLSSLTHAITRFLVFEQIKEDFIVNHLFAKELRLRNLPRLLEKKLYQAEEALDNNTGIDCDYFLLRYKLQAERFNYDMVYSNITSRKSILKQTEEIKKFTTYVIIHSMLEILASYIALIIQFEKYGTNFADQYLHQSIIQFPTDKLYALVKNSRYAYILNVYISMMKAFKKRGGLKVYEHYRDTVYKHQKKLSFDEMSFHVSRMISCCILGAKYGSSRKFFNSELVKLYDQFLKNEYFKDNKNKYIPPNLFRAIILHAAMMGKMTWLNKIIHQYSVALHPNDRENLQLFAQALYYYHSSQAGEALQSIAKMKITYFIFKYDIYNLKLRIFYEQGLYQEALELLHTYKQFLRTDSMMQGSRKVFHKKFVLYMEKLIRIAEGSKKDEPGLLVQRLENSDTIVNKEWLIEKLKQCEKNIKRYQQAG